MKLCKIIGTNSTTTNEIAQSRTCEFCIANIFQRKPVDMREFICIAPNQNAKWLTPGNKDELRFYIQEPCFKIDQTYCFIWQDNKSKGGE